LNVSNQYNGNLSGDPAITILPSEQSRWKAKCIQDPNYATDEEETAVAYSNRLEIDIVHILK